MSVEQEKSLLSPRSLREKGLSPEEASLSSIIHLLSLTISQRSSKQTYILQEITRKIKFFSDLTRENGEYVHRIACERLTYEYIPSGNVFFT